MLRTPSPCSAQRAILELLSASRTVLGLDEGVSNVKSIRIGLLLTCGSEGRLVLTETNRIKLRDHPKRSLVHGSTLAALLSNPDLRRRTTGARREEIKD
ncbi:hypothetical protein VTN31DRAFT_1598 [Thermomyces dupontii]|uniref:uncharacterized protein n=1 Tax=Talaromyces thermophilus TaxID=28565 RepID=UPI0037424373